MKKRSVLLIAFLFFSTGVLAVPIDTSSAVGGFVSWRDCTTPEQFFCDGALGSSSPTGSGGTADRSVTGVIEASTLSDSIDGGPLIGTATFSADLLNSGMGISLFQAGIPGPDGRVMTTVGGYQGLVYTGDATVTKTLSATMLYTKSATVTPTVDGNGVAYSKIALIRTSTNSMIVDPDLHFLGLNSVGRDTAFDIVFSGTAGLNTIIVESQLDLEDPLAASSAALSGALTIDLNPGDVFFVVAAAQVGGNQSGFGIMDLTTGFTDTSDLQVLSVPAPASIWLVVLGMFGLFAMSREGLLRP